MNILEVKVHLQFDPNYLIIIMLGHPKFPQRIRATYLWTVTQYIFFSLHKKDFRLGITVPDLENSIGHPRCTISSKPAYRITNFFYQVFFHL